MGRKKNLQYETRIGNPAVRPTGSPKAAPEAPQLRTWFDHQRNVMVVEVVDAAPPSSQATPGPEQCS
jgi:hypothetical protein